MVKNNLRKILQGREQDYLKEIWKVYWAEVWYKNWLKQDVSSVQSLSHVQLFVTP